MSRLFLIGSRAMLWGLFTAVVGSLPAAVRLTTQGQPWLAAWLAVSGLIAVPSILAVLGGALARRGWRELVRGRTSAAFVAVAVWLMVFCPIVLKAGAYLHKTTHHRGLGGATFGAVALAVAILAAVVALRVTGEIVRIGLRHPRFASTVNLASVSCGLYVALTLTYRAVSSAGLGWSSLSARTQVGLVDSAVWMFCVVVACSLRRPEYMHNVVRVVVAVLAVILVGAGAILPLGSPPLAQAIWIEAPMAATIAELGPLAATRSD